MRGGSGEGVCVAVEHFVTLRDSLAAAIAMAATEMRSGQVLFSSSQGVGLEHTDHYGRGSADGPT